MVERVWLALQARLRSSPLHARRFAAVNFESQPAVKPGNRSMDAHGGSMLRFKD
jgi:hypothetical protein